MGAARKTPRRVATCPEVSPAALAPVRPLNWRRRTGRQCLLPPRSAAAAPARAAGPPRRAAAAPRFCCGCAFSKMSLMLDLALVRALRAFDRLITGLAGATERAAKRAAATSKSLKKASNSTRARAAAAAGEDTGAWDSAAAAAAKRYERRAAMEALLLCAAVGFVSRLLLGNAGVLPTLRMLLAPLGRFLADPGAKPVAAWEWLFGAGPRAARAAGGQMYTLPPVDGALHRLFVAAYAALPSVEHSLIMVRRGGGRGTLLGRARVTAANERFNARAHAPPAADAHSGRGLCGVSVRLRGADGAVGAARGGDGSRGAA